MLAIITNKRVSRSVGFLVSGKWVMLCAHAYANDWHNFIRIADAYFSAHEEDHCMRCFWEEVIRVSRERII